MLIDITYQELKVLSDYIEAAYDTFVTEANIKYDHKPSQELLQKLLQLSAFASLAAKIVATEIAMDQPEHVIPDEILKRFKQQDDDITKNFLNY